METTCQFLICWGYHIANCPRIGGTVLLEESDLFGLEQVIWNNWTSYIGGEKIVDPNCRSQSKSKWTKSLLQTSQSQELGAL